MTKQTDRTKDTSGNGNQPDWVVKTPRGHGRKQRLERIGAGWNREDGGICLRLAGIQLVEDDLYIYSVSTEAEAS